jgi:hypothetical protein
MITNFILWLKKNFIKIISIFFIGFFTRFFINYYLNINVFIDYIHIISILYYLHLSCIVVYINQLNLDFNFFNSLIKKFYWGDITYKNIQDGFKSIIYIINKEINKNTITMHWEGVSHLDDSKKEKGNILYMSSPEQSGKGKQPAIIDSPSSGGRDSHSPPIGAFVGGRTPSPGSVASAAVGNSRAMNNSPPMDPQTYFELYNNFVASSPRSENTTTVGNSSQVVRFPTVASSSQLPQPALQQGLGQQAPGVIVQPGNNAGAQLIPPVNSNPGIAYPHYPTLSFPSYEQGIRYDPFLVPNQSIFGVSSRAVHSYWTPQDPIHLPYPSLARRIQITTFVDNIIQIAAQNDNIQLRNMGDVLDRIKEVYGRQTAYALGAELRKVIYSDPNLYNKFVVGRTGASGVSWSKIGVRNREIRTALTT